MATSISQRAHAALVKLAAPPTPGQGVMARGTAMALRRAGYVEIVSHMLGKRSATRLTPEGQKYLARGGPARSKMEELADKVVAARLRFRVALDANQGAPFGVNDQTLREALNLIDTLAEACMALLPDSEEDK